MSKKSNWFEINLGKYWFIQLTIITVLIIYSLATSMAIVVVVNDPTLLGNNTTPSQTQTVDVTIIFESMDSNHPITWDSVVTTVTTNTSLFNVMQSKFKLNGSSYGQIGYLITGINSLENKDPNYWTFYYYSHNNGWIYAPKGVSFFLLNNDYTIKWVYGPASV